VAGGAGSAGGGGGAAPGAERRPKAEAKPADGPCGAQWEGSRATRRAIR
jgi:hypothetical protein